jgi:MFS family permease
VSFQVARRIVGDKNLVKTSVQGLLLRGWSYLGVGAAALFLSGPIFVIPALLLYPIAGGLAFAIYYTSANTMMFTTVRSKSAGAALGVYSAVVGIASMAGSFVSGFVSVYSGYYVTFILSGVFLFAASVVIGRVQNPLGADESALL